MTPGLDGIRECFDGTVPGVMATCAPDGTPNVAYLSQTEYVDPEHLALSFQFFNKTRQNILANPQARLLLIHPQTAAMYRLTLRYLRTETEGPLFERMRAKLAGIASHTGMSGVFRLKGSDVYRVLAIEQVPGQPLPAPPPRRNLLAAVRAGSQRLAAATDLAGLLEAMLGALREAFDIHHAMVLLLDEDGQKLFTLASGGYERSGIGSEIPLGEGVIGVAARERTPIRIAHMTGEYAYGRAVRDALAQGGLAGRLETEIPPPGLPESRSQLAVPVTAGRRLLGVLYVESPQDLRFGYDDEDALVTLAAQLGLAIAAFRESAEVAEPAAAETCPAPAGGPPVAVRHYAENDSVFFGEDYLIKGVAGAILWTLLRDHAESGRTAFANRELRVDPRIRLPELSDNLEARLILLERRLVERDACVRLEKTGRGRFRLCVNRPLQLVDVPATRA
ncbi:MAG TPA: GAF domain-containing protein [Frateuria sp.]|uniref:GAF domain-containing protein n=1 Tax=Frateuria sp. TaxID=2211372 RepID=UPI002D7EB41B|nr:GAF domain-containing protein [Frateuria sp.]HET6805352.1 GAF domain-containing protein [Frateuria sp.]